MASTEREKGEAVGVSTLAPHGAKSASSAYSDDRPVTGILSPNSEPSTSSPQKKKKASPSDVIFGRPPGSDEASRVYEPLISDSSGQASTEGSKGTSDANATDHAVGMVETEGAKSTETASIGVSSSSVERSSADEQSDAGMDVDQQTSTASFHATPSTTATTANSLAEAATEGDEDVKVLPALFEDADSDDIVILVADMLMRLTAHNDMLPLHPSALTRFHSRATPSITVLSYLKRIAKYTSLEKSCTLILLVYIDRVCQRIAGFTICSLTVHRFVCAAVVCASKALCDSFSTNGHYARVGGISLVELNMLEKEFLNIIDWKLSCSGALLQHYYTSLVRSHSAYRLSASPRVSSATAGSALAPPRDDMG